MKQSSAFLALIAVLGTVTCAAAQDKADKIPPENGMKASEIIAKIESRPDFRYLDSVDWEDEGYYDITYYTSDKAKVEIKIDASSGKPRD